MADSNFIMYTTLGNLILRKTDGLWRKENLGSNPGPFSYKLCGLEQFISTLDFNLLICKMETKINPYFRSCYEY